MKTIMYGKRFQILAAGLVVGLISLACATLFNPGSAQNITPQAETAVQPSSKGPVAQTQPAGSTPSTGNPSPNPPSPAAGDQKDPLDHLLDLHGVQFTLTTARPDGTSRSINAQVDAAGNMHVTMDYKGYALKDLPKGFDPSVMPGSSEVYVVDGKAYRPSKKDPEWNKKPVNEDFRKSLTLWLHGSDGPALWLEILPTGSIQKNGDESVGGFKAVKYLVKGTVENQTISGTLWEEPGTDALVQAELHVPGALLSMPDKPQSGELKITLSAQKADIAPIKLPATPSGAGGATPAAGNSNAPTVSNIYPLTHLAFFTSRIAITPGKVWVSSIQGSVDALDVQSGAQNLSVSLFQGGGPKSAQPVYDMIFDGQNLWVLASPTNGDNADWLFVISPVDGKILKKFDTTGWHNRSWTKMGFSPGKVWVESHVIDTQTLDAKEIPQPFEPHYAYDGKGWMWINGTFCEGCGYTIWLFNADNPAVHKGGPKAAQAGGLPMELAGDRMWISTSQSNGAVTAHILQAYPADGEKINLDSQPLLGLPMADDQPTRLLYDGHALWLLPGGKNQGSVFQLDPQTGSTVNKLDIPSSVKGDFPCDIASDGHNLWVLTIKQLVKVSLPWAAN